MVRLNYAGLQAQTAGGKKEPEEGKIAQSNHDIVSFFFFSPLSLFLAKSSVSSGHVEPLHNMISRWTTQAQM